LFLLVLKYTWTAGCSGHRYSVFPWVLCLTWVHVHAWSIELLETFLWKYRTRNVHFSLEWWGTNNRVLPHRLHCKSTWAADVLVQTGRHLIVSDTWLTNWAFVLKWGELKRGNLYTEEARWGSLRVSLYLSAHQSLFFMIHMK
jgi:hypothetical protein